MRVEQAPAAPSRHVSPRQAIAELQRTQQLLAEAQALAHIGSWEWDLVTDRITWSDEHYRIFGFELGTPIDFETASRCQARGRVECDAAGHPVRKVGTIQDVTERAQATAALHRAETQYRDLVENAVEGVFRTTPDGRFVMANQSLARMLGYDTPEQLIAERVDLERHHYVRPEARARFKQLLDTHGIVQGLEYEARHRNGSTIWLRDHARVVRDLDGTTFYEGMVEDVTNRRRADALLDLRARQQAAVARLGQAAIAGSDLVTLLDCAASIVADTLGVEFSQILERRPDGDLLFRTGIGWSQEVLGVIVPGGARSQAGLTLRSEHPVVMDNWGPALRAQMPPHLGAPGVNSGVTVIIGTPDHPYGVLGAHTAQHRSFTIDDINFLRGIASILAAAVVRLRGEEVRQHLLARAISAQEEERTRIARELHDETGQALSAILLGLRNLEDSETIAQARRLAQRLRDLTAETVRDVGRLARGLRPSTLDHLGLLPALQRYGEELQESHHLAVRISGDAEQRYPANLETTLYRIVQEALTYVAKHARARSAEVRIQRDDGTVRATVQDDGTGFDLHAALDTTPSRRTLGLMGMHERATLVGGSLVVSSAPGRGTSITVELPVARP